MSETHPEQVTYAGGKAASSVGPAMHLIPTVAMEVLARRMMLGIERKGDKAWNAISANQEVLFNREFAIERCSHVIHHAMKLRDQLAHGPADNEADSMEDNAGAISWGGAFLSCVVDKITKIQPKPRLGESIIVDGTYICGNAKICGPMLSDERGRFFCISEQRIAWKPDGTPVKIDQGVTDEELAGYRIKPGYQE